MPLCFSLLDLSFSLQSVHQKDEDQLVCMLCLMNSPYCKIIHLQKVLLNHFACRNTLCECVSNNNIEITHTKTNLTTEASIQYLDVYLFRYVHCFTFGLRELSTSHFSEFPVIYLCSLLNRQANYLCLLTFFPLGIDYFKTITWLVSDA